VVIGRDGGSVGRAVEALRGPGAAVAGFVGDNLDAAREMAAEMLGGVDQVVSVGGEGAGAGGEGARPPRPPYGV